MSITFLKSNLSALPMHKHALTLLLPVALLALRTLSASPSALPTLRHATAHVDYYKQAAAEFPRAAGRISLGTDQMSTQAISKSGRSLWFKSRLMPIIESNEPSKA
jgi:hypothetical protein